MGDNPLAPARGVLVGTALAIAFWLGLLALVR
jgi:hypothetical protein